MAYRHNRPTGGAFSSDVGTDETATTDNAVARWDGTTAAKIQNSVVTIADSTGNMAGVGTLGCGAITSTGDIVSNGVSTQIALSGAKAIGASPTEAKGLVLRNTTIARTGGGGPDQEWSPSIYLAGQGWKTDATAGSQEVVFRIDNQPFQGTANPGGSLVVASNVNGGSYGNRFTLSSSGSGTFTGALVVASQITANGGSNGLLMGHASTGHIKWTTDGGGDIGGASDNRPNNIYAKAAINCGTTITAVNSSWAYSTAIGFTVADFTGLDTGTNYEVSGTAATAVLAISGPRTDGSGNISTALVADVNNATITADHKIASFGWANNSNAYTEVASITGDGSIKATAATGQIALSGAKAIGPVPSEAKGLVLRNSTDAADGAQQSAPGLYLAGQGWKTDATAASRETVWRLTNRPVQGAANPTSNLTWAADINAGGYSNVLTLGSGGEATLNASSGADLLWAADGGGDIGASGASRPNNIYCKTNVVAAGYVSSSGSYVSSGDAYLYDADLDWQATGALAGVTANLYTNSDRAVVIGGRNTSRDAASAIVVATVYDRNAASITNAATVRLHSFGWTNNSDAYTEVAGIYADGHMQLDGEIEIDGDLNHDGSNVGFYGTAPVAQQTGVAVTAAAIHTALVNLGLITA